MCFLTLNICVSYISALCSVEVAFFSLVAGMSIVSGFATTLMMAKRRDSDMFDKVRKSRSFKFRFDSMQFLLLNSV